MRYLWNQTIKFIDLSALLCFSLIGLMCLVSCQHGHQDKKNSIKDQNKAARSSYIKGVSLFKKEKLNVAQGKFESVNRGNKYFVPSLLEIQKINYIQGDWDSFFGIANYYRSVLLDSKTSVQRYFQQDLLALEVLALIRHCRFNLAYQVVEYGLSIGRSANKKVLKIRQAGYFFKLKELVASKKFKKKNTGLIKRMNFWPVKRRQLDWLDNPKNIKVKVKSEC